MNNPIGIPLSSHQIPAGTGLVQTVECNGIQYDENVITHLPLLIEPITAQITTFSNGMRRVCCPKAHHKRTPGEVRCESSIGGAKCIYAWEDPKTNS